MGKSLRIITIFALISCCVSAAENTLQISTSSYAGRAGDSVQGVRIQSDGTIVLAANVSSGPLISGSVQTLGAGTGYIFRLSPDGKKLITATRVAPKVLDIALDGKDCIYVAADTAGALKLDSKASAIVWKKEGVFGRIDAGIDGHCALLRFGADAAATTGSGQIQVLDPAGKPIGQFRGHRNTLDVCLDSTTKTIIHVGWRQDNAFDGKKKFPVQIAYVRGQSYSGDIKYTLYDWATGTDAPEFINKPENNMADTRGYRCAMGGDGKLYCAFECAGGNHIFRYEPQLVDSKWVGAGSKKVKGDKYHEFFNTNAEHKTFFGRYEPGTGKYISGQQFCARLTKGNKGSTVRIEGGGVAASEKGDIAITGRAAFGLPIDGLLPNTGDYTGGGFVMAMQSDLSKRIYCNRMQVGAAGQAVDMRTIGGKRVVVYGGTIDKKSPEGFFVKEAIQSEGAADCGFYAVITE